MRNSNISRQQFKVLFLAQGIAALLLATSSRASAAIEIKDTSYAIPSGAYFVSPNGADSNSGRSADSPWSVAKAIASAPAGSTIVFRGGTYRNVGKVGINKNLTLQAYPYEKAWIKGSVIVTGWVADGSIWRKDGWNYSFPQNFSSSYIDPKYPLAGYRDMVFVNGVALGQVGSKAEVGAGKFYVDPNNNQLYIGNNPTGNTVEATTQQEVFSIWKSSINDPSGTTIKGLGFAHYADQAVSVGAAKVKLEDNTFAWNGMQGAKFFGHSGNTSGVAADAVVSGNNFSYNGMKGVGGSYVHRLLFENNVVSYNNTERFSKIWDAGGVKFNHTTGGVWRRNSVNHNYGTGLWLDGSSLNATIVNNTVHNNEAIGIFFEVSHRAIIAGNVAYNNGYTGIMVSNSSSANVYNNTLVNNGGTNIKLKDTKRNNTNTEEIAAGITWIARDNVFKNNILSNTTGGSLFDTSNCDTKEKSDLTVDASDYNAYYRTSVNRPSSAINWSLGQTACLTKYKSITDFNAGNQFEEHALAIDDVAINPFFVDENNENFNLKPGSSAIGRGAPLPENIASAMGLPAGVQVDLGALQSTTVLGSNQVEGSKEV